MAAPWTSLVGGCEVEAHPPRGGGDEEEKDGGAGVELVHQGLALLQGGHTLLYLPLLIYFSFFAFLSFLFAVF